MAKKKEELQQKYGLFELDDDSNKLISVYDTEEEANAALEKLCLVLCKAGMGHDVDGYYVEEVDSQLDVEKDGYVVYCFDIIGVMTKTKKKGGKKKKRPLKIFEDVKIDSDDDDATWAPKLAKALSDLNEGDYEVTCLYESVEFNKKAKKFIRVHYMTKSLASVSIAIDGIANRSSKEVKAELFKRLGL